MVSLVFAAALVKVSQFGFNPTNSTAAFQRALDSGAQTVVVDRQTSDWVVEPLHVRSNTRIVFENDVTVRAKKGMFKGRNDILFSAHCVKNVEFIGQGRAILAMNAEDYRNPEFYRPSEFRHAIRLEQVTDVKISNLIIQGSGGDGIYIDTLVGGLIERVTSENNVRQGISVVSCCNLTIRDCIFAVTQGMPPQAGIDIEPDGGRDFVENVLIENCLFVGNAGWGIDFHLDNLNHNSRPVSVKVANCRAYGNRGAGVRLDSAGLYPLKGNVSFENCHVSGNGGPALLMRRQTAESLALKITDCVFDGRGSTSDVVQVVNSGYRPFGGIVLENVKVLADSGCRPFSFTSYPGAGAKDISGGITVERNGISKFYPASDFVADNTPSAELFPFAFSVKPISEYRLRPVDPSAKKKVDSPYYWFAGVFVQYVPGAGVYPIRFRKSLAGAGKKPVVRVRVDDPDGKTVDSFTTDGFEDYMYPLTARKAGIYHFVFTAYEYGVAVDSEFPGQGMLADVAARCWKTRKSADREHVYYFRVKAGTEKVSLALGTHCSSVRAQLIAPDGSVVDDGAGQGNGGNFFLSAERKNSGESETWAVRLEKIAPRCDIMLGHGCTPVICSDKDMVLEEY